MKGESLSKPSQDVVKKNTHKGSGKRICHLDEKRILRLTEKEVAEHAR